MTIIPSSVSRVVRSMIPGMGNSFSRRHERYTCSIIAKLNFIERGFSIDGELNEISLGGGRFRPASTHILMRSEDSVVLVVEAFAIEAYIVNTTPLGYGLKFREPIAETQLTEIRDIKKLDLF
ncbi:PilZ domain-containing protein [Chthonobacter albigriseus]|uniref:PilZ domain-containing protein n=1 Tax=Chthonobacter albigriseus TaxID=1683161 RepID=UPI0015EF1BDF|nr:PilZ domain-containing protein [Chthonobacter albigriseus]